MKKDFRAKAAAAASLDILHKHFDPQMDAWLLLGRFKNGGSYAVAWESRHRPGLVDCEIFESKTGAEVRFDAIIANAEQSDDPVFEKDFQKQAVYDWEDEDLMPFGKKIDEGEARVLLRRVAQDCKVPVPDLQWEPFTNTSEYDDGMIWFGARDNISLLHEMAHHIREQHDGEDSGLAPHAPAFVGVAGELYRRYAGIDENLLKSSAEQRNLLGDEAASGIALPPEKPAKKRREPTASRRPAAILMPQPVL